MNSKRLNYLDMAKGIGIFLVLIGHLQGDSIFALSPYIHPLCVWIFSFHMPFFFLVSGIVMYMKGTDTSSMSLKEEVRKRFRSIMVPYIWFSLILLVYIAYSLYIAGTLFVNIGNLFITNVWYFVSCYGINVLWFLPALFFGQLLFLVLNKYCRGKWLAVSVALLSAVGYILSFLIRKTTHDTTATRCLYEFGTTLIRPLITCGWIAIGYYLRMLTTGDNAIAKLFSKWDSPSDRKERLKYRMYYILLGLLFMGIFTALHLINRGIDIRTLAFGNVPAYLICAFMGSCGLILICKGLPPVKLLTFWGRGSLIFMAVHNNESILYLALKLSMYVNQYLTFARGYICYAIIVAVITLFSSLMIILISKCFPFIIGKKYGSR